MIDQTPTIAETVTAIRTALQDYIEATYHIGDPALVEQRRRLLGCALGPGEGGL